MVVNYLLSNLLLLFDTNIRLYLYEVNLKLHKPLLVITVTYSLSYILSKAQIKKSAISFSDRFRL